MKTFYYNGTILTMEDASLYAEAVCVENGRILAVGSFDDVMQYKNCLLYTSPSPRDGLLSRMPSSA